MARPKKAERKVKEAIEAIDEKIRLNNSFKGFLADDLFYEAIDQDEFEKTMLDIIGKHKELMEIRETLT